MLVITRRELETLIFYLPDGRQIEVTVVRIQDGRAQLSIKAPQDIKVLRAELAAKMREHR